jgi:hypothetical protein
MSREEEVEGKTVGGGPTNRYKLVVVNPILYSTSWLYKSTQRHIQR